MLRWEFSVEGVAHQGSINSMNPQDFDGLAAQDQVIVLHDPRNPANNILIRRLRARLSIYPPRKSLWRGGKNNRLAYQIMRRCRPFLTVSVKQSAADGVRLGL